MKYIVGYSHREYAFDNVLVPKKVYSSEEKARGKKEFTAVEDTDLEVLRADKVFSGLEASKKLRVLDNLPGWAKSSADREKELLSQIKALEAKDQSAVLKAENEQIKAEAQKVIDGLRKEVAALKNNKE